MSPIKEVCILSVLIVSVTSFQANCDPFNQFRFYCFPITFCYSEDCKQSPCGTYNPISQLVKIKSTKIIPKCAFTNSNFLKRIYGVNSGIRIIASGAFANLTYLDDINLSMNSIQELHVGTFYNVSATSLDLSWNKLSYIQEGTFQGLYNLKSLNLSRNELTILPIHSMTLELTEINLSYNLFTRVIFTSRRMPKLKDINMSFNRINKIALSFENPVNTIDLTSNELKKFDHIDIFSCEVFRIAMNRFSKAPEVLPLLSLKKISLYPNPWNCDELRKLWTQLQNNLIQILDMSDDQLVCGISQDNITNQVFAKLSSNIYCEEDSDCEEDRICRTNKCLNPCAEGLCHSSSICQVNKHRMRCTCPEGLKSDPTDPYSACQDVECFVSADCPLNLYCFGDRKCRRATTGWGVMTDNWKGLAVTTEPWWAYEIYGNDTKYVDLERIIHS